MWWLILILVVILVMCVWRSNVIETMIPRNRRLMSYDLRGDIPIPFVPVSPWNNPEVGPIYNRPLW